MLKKKIKWNTHNLYLKKEIDKKDFKYMQQGVSLEKLEVINFSFIQWC